jgi:hypothetical protein
MNSYSFIHREFDEVLHVLLFVQKPRDGYLAIMKFGNNSFNRITGISTGLALM